MRLIIRRLMVKGRASLAIEATIAVPVFAIVTVALILSYRILTMENMIQVGVEQANLQFSSVLLRADKCGFLDAYLQAEAGEERYSASFYSRKAYQMLREDMGITTEYDFGRFVHNHIGDDSESTSGALARAFNKEIYMADSLWCDYEGMRTVYDSVTQAMQEMDSSKADYEKVLTECLRQIIVRNVQEYVSNSFSYKTFNTNRISVSNWRCNWEGGVVIYSADVTFYASIFGPSGNASKHGTTFTITGCTVLED